MATTAAIYIAGEDFNNDIYENKDYYVEKVSVDSNGYPDTILYNILKTLKYTLEKIEYHNKNRKEQYHIHLKNSAHSFANRLLTEVDSIYRRMAYVKQVFNEGFHYNDYLENVSKYEYEWIFIIDLKLQTIKVFNSNHKISDVCVPVLPHVYINQLYDELKFKHKAEMNQTIKDIENYGLTLIWDKRLWHEEYKSLASMEGWEIDKTKDTYQLRALKDKGELRSDMDAVALVNTQAKSGDYLAASALGFIAAQSQ